MARLEISPNSKKRTESPARQINSSPRKKAKLLPEDASSDAESVKLVVNGFGMSDDDDDDSDGGAALDGTEGFRINEEYARRFEHNKKREELDRLQDKYGKDSGRGVGGSDDESSSDEEEDDEGILASGDLDVQVQRTLEAIQKKDPRVYDSKTTFYTDSDNIPQSSLANTAKEEKPMFLSDYHRETLLHGGIVPDEPVKVQPTYAEQQNELKNAVLREMNKEIGGKRSGGGSDSEDGDFLVRTKSKARLEGIPPDGQEKSTALDVASADQNPEKYLAEFLSARAWVPTKTSRLQAFESDDEEEERRADEFEEAYNLRFEDPDSLNQKLVSHARDAVVKYSVRKEPLNARKKARETERTRKATEKEIRVAEKSRLRKLKVSELEEKLQKVKEAAGTNSDLVATDDLGLLLDDAWDDTRWDDLMKQRFNEEYYGSQDFAGGEEGTRSRSKKSKKPKWADDIDVKDLVPDFEDGENEGQKEFESSIRGDSEIDEISKEASSQKREQSKQTNHDKKKQLRLERRQIEQLVDDKMDIDEKLSTFGKRHAGHFRYRETSPLTWGLTASDILMADDSQLNQFAGLKKLAAFRDPIKKQKDKKKFGKKGRLRQWRLETFGNKDGPQITPTEDDNNALPVKSPRNKAQEGLQNGSTGREKRKKTRI